MWIKSLLILNPSSWFSICFINKLSALSSPISSSMQSRICTIVSLSVRSLISIKCGYRCLSKILWSVADSIFRLSIWISSVTIFISSVPLIKLQTKQSFGRLLFGILIFTIRNHKLMLTINQIKNLFRVFASNNSST